ncbi:MAG: hypothetical protein GF421_13640 [Candidatus Aminicenantes bacterium]|nr:hypothetical protein [Candidatus Aminicenantes bacterium]
MYLIYSFFLLAALCFYFPVYLVKLKILKNEPLHFSDRIGSNLPLKKREQKSIWIHAVSVGEVMSLQNLVRRIKETHPNWTVYFSTLTNSGFEVAQKKLSFVDELFFVPFDFRVIVKRFFKTFQPNLFVLTESEFWPNLIREAQTHTQGVLLVNGRMSSHSHKRYKWVKIFMKKILFGIDRFLVQTQEDEQRLEEIGGCSSRVQVVGNLKAEIKLAEMTKQDVISLKQNLNIPPSFKAVVAGSTRNGEERILLSAFAKAMRKRNDIKLIIAPRHIERSGEVVDCCDELGLKAVKKTCLSPEVQWEVLVLDTIGELALIYAVADCVFIGGSLVPWGGQNLLEPAFYSKPVFFGPYMDNFAFFAGEFLKAGAAEIVRNEKDLRRLFCFTEDKKMEDMGKKAKQTLNSLQGATQKTLRAIEDMMSEKLE